MASEMVMYGECGACIVKRNTGRDEKGLAPCRTCALEAERDRFKAFIASIPGPQDRGHGLIRCGTCGWYASSHSPDCLFVKAQAVLRGEEP